MKKKTLLAAILIAMGTVASADTVDVEKDEIKVFVEKKDGKTTKKVIRNGKELTEDEIQDLEESGELKVLHLDGNLHKKHGKGMKKVMVIESDEDSPHGKHVKVIKKHLGDSDAKHVWVYKHGDNSKDIEVEVSKDGNKTIEKIIVNGKELSAEEIEKMKANGELKVLHMEKAHSGEHKVIIAGEKGDIDFDFINVDVLTEDISGNGDNSFITKKIVVSADDDPNRGRLGFLANVKDDGWHVTSVMDDSGAKDAGMKKGDIVIEIAGQSLIKQNDENKMKLKKHEVGDQVNVKLLREGKLEKLTVEAKAFDREKVKNNFSWEQISELTEDLNGIENRLVFINKNGDFEWNEDDINIHFPDSLKDMNIFISDGQSTSKLLGARHKFTSMSKDLAKYFGTKTGVLVLNVDDSNVFGLKDGDVIQEIDGNEVDSPKSVIKYLLKAEDQEKIKMKIVRHKKTKTLKAKS